MYFKNKLLENSGSTSADWSKLVMQLRGVLSSWEIAPTKTYLVLSLCSTSKILCWIVWSWKTNIWHFRPKKWPVRSWISMCFFSLAKFMKHIFIMRTDSSLHFEVTFMKLFKITLRNSCNEVKLSPLRKSIFYFNLFEGYFKDSSFLSLSACLSKSSISLIYIDVLMGFMSLLSVILKISVTGLFL